MARRLSREAMTKVWGGGVEGVSEFIAGQSNGGMDNKQW
jgi:hypothetical protein